jgi:hypothetical protein
MQFFILMVDYGKSYPGKTGPSGYEATCNPEFTRRQIVSEVADLLASDRKSVHFVKFVDGNHMEDVTAEIVREAEALMLQAAE